MYAIVFSMFHEDEYYVNISSSMRVDSRVISQLSKKNKKDILMAIDLLLLLMHEIGDDAGITMGLCM